MAPSAPPPRAVEDDDAQRELAARAAGLAERRDALARARRDEQAVADALPVVMAAVADVRRSRDTADTQRLRQCRAVFEQIVGDVEALQVMLARVSRRVLDHELEPSDPLRRRAERAQHEALRALQRFASDLNTAAGTREVTDDTR